jgi:hypothetical protein
MRRAAWWEIALRFVFGGVITTAAGFVAERWGAGPGGLFLAFPAILPATLTLVKEYEGRAQAADDARGAVLGAVALAGFAATVWFAAEHHVSGLTTLALATFVWLGVSVSLWKVRYRRA